MSKFVGSVGSRRIVYLSSDGIFSGERGLYSEKDLPKPKTLYGKNLAICEDIIKSKSRNFFIIRPSYIYGFSNGVLDYRLNRVKNMLKLGKEVSFFCDMFKSPLGVKQVAKAVIDLAFLDYNGTIHVAGKRVSVYDFYLQAMRALDIDTTNLKSSFMPKSNQFLKDTSLDSSLWQKLTGTKIVNIKRTLQSF
jgi:dTDP-4-dehydrorhamnose reductase